MIEILICKNGKGFWDKKLVDADPQKAIKDGLVVDGEVFEIRKLHATKGGLIKDFLYAVEPGAMVTENMVKNALGIPPHSE